MEGAASVSLRPPVAAFAARSILGGKEAPKSVGSNGETVFRVKGERAFEVDVWAFNRRCRLL